ncbi:ergothioneine biosynthesis glutamate--cysteine ligase EgtA [Angustibacter sp. McL0619]|uniref:ergothioneine biosynthesis glutamate--cysteine ligase EgtA n=1 Tax=Angustibacter sp. McL0619 TaxID=3415676 RepID=UPI003CE985FF
MATESFLGAATTDPRGALGVDEVREHVASLALRDDRPVGTSRVGLELESHLVDLVAPDCRPSWDEIGAALADLPLMPGGSGVSVEPGGQVELSGPATSDVVRAVQALRSDHRVLRTHLRQSGLALSLAGTDPVRPALRVNPGPRYVAMEEHWRATGQSAAGLAMMCSTASVQVNLDAGPRSGWAQRTELAHLLGPVLVAVSACSPWLTGRATGWRSARQRVWGDLDVLRCGPLRGGPDPAVEWAGYALEAPVMLVGSAAGMAAVRSRVSMREWIRGDVLLDGRRPTLVDVDQHLTTLFPPARLRGWIEVRYLDAAPVRWWPALVAVLVTLMDVPAAADRAAQLTEPVRREWTAAARDGLAHPEIARAARACLELAGQHCPDELVPDVARLADLVGAGRSPGDELADLATRSGPRAALLEDCDA